MRKIIKKLSIILIFAMVISSICPSDVSAASKKYVKSLTVSKKSMILRREVRLCCLQRMVIRMELL